VRCVVGLSTVRHDTPQQFHTFEYRITVTVNVQCMLRESQCCLFSAICLKRGVRSPHSKSGLCVPPYTRKLRLNYNNRANRLQSSLLRKYDTKVQKLSNSSERCQNHRIKLIWFGATKCTSVHDTERSMGLHQSAQACTVWSYLLLKPECAGCGSCSA